MITSEKIKEMIAKQLNKPVSDVTDEKDVVKDLGADSLDVVEMLMGLEEEFGVELSDEEAVALKTVGDIVKVIETKQN